MTSKEEIKQALLKTDEQSRAAFYEQAIESGIVGNLEVYRSAERTRAPHRSALGNEEPHGFARSAVEFSLLAGRKTPSSSEVIIKVADREESLSSVFYVDLHACHGGHLCYLQFVLYGQLDDAEYESTGNSKGTYALQAILLPGSPCPGPLRTLSPNLHIWRKP